MIEPLSTASLGGLAIDQAQSTITKWVTTQLTARVEVALRDRVLRGRLAKDQQFELAAVIKAAVHLTTAEQFPGEERLQGLFCKALLNDSPQDWPLVNGSDLSDLVHDVHAWVTKSDPQPGVHPSEADPATHSYLAALCRNIIAQFGFRAENNGAKNSILYPRWNRFCTTELFTSYQQQVASISGPASPSPTLPRRFGNIPPLATARQDRLADQQLTSALAEGGTVVVCQILSGMGGVGKTQIAAHYAHQRWSQHEVGLLLWINATSRETIIAAYARAGSELCQADSLDSDQAGQTFLEWLDGPEAPPWLIILDDLTNPRDLNGLWPPSSRQGRTIVTTRRRDAALDTHNSARINVDLFTPAEARAYLESRLRHDPGIPNEADILAMDLGYLPLALTQASSYILDQPGMTCADYRELLADRSISLAELGPETFPDGHEDTVAATLPLSIDLVEEPASDGRPRPYIKGLATTLLEMASVLDPAGIPSDLFTTDDARAVLKTREALRCGLRDHRRHHSSSLSEEILIRNLGVNVVDVKHWIPILASKDEILKYAVIYPVEFCTYPHRGRIRLAALI